MAAAQDSFYVRNAGTFVTVVGFLVAFVAGYTRLGTRVDYLEEGQRVVVQRQDKNDMAVNEIKSDVKLIAAWVKQQQEERHGRGGNP
jgi:hypothetical protein